MSASLADEGLVIPDAPTEPGEFERSLRLLRDNGRKLLVAYVTGGLHDEWPDVDDWSLPDDKGRQQDLFDQDLEDEFDIDVAPEVPKEQPKKGPMSIDPLLGF